MPKHQPTCLPQAGKKKVKIAIKESVLILMCFRPDTCYQLVKSATSTGENYRAACKARSKNEFFSKICIVVEEVDELRSNHEYKNKVK